jgi:asparagine synthase (glutamine-hydrolysing)
MCGIFGYYTKNSVTTEQLMDSTNCLSHRGPDSFGYTRSKWKEFEIGLGHRRLSIIDLDPRSDQPFSSDDGQVQVVFNGEIYNYLELKSCLDDYNFKTTSDTEVILALYLELGINFVNKLVGIFSICIYDNNNGNLFLIKDRNGVKPLYYYIKDDSLVFSSELNSIVSYPYFKKKINKASVQTMLSMGYIPSPHSIYDSVFKLLPGSILIFNEGKVIENIKYWDHVENYLRSNQFDIGVSDIKEEIINSVRRNKLTADVEVVTLLSGGVDSSLVSILASKIGKIRSYTLGFKDSRFDESKYAMHVSDTFNFENVLHTIDIDDLVKVVKIIPEIYDEPFGDPSQIPTYLISKKVSEDGYKVILSGDGGDEYFYGYSSLDRLRSRHAKYKFFHPIAILLDPILTLSDKFFPLYLLSLFSSIESFFFGIKSGYSGWFASRSMKRNNKQKEQIHESFSFLQRLEKQNILEKQYIFDQLIYLPDDILTKVDRATMYCSLECRVPLLDHTVTDMAYRIPQDKHIDGPKKKLILKTILKDYMGEEFTERQKTGFSIPMDTLLRNEKIKIELERLSNRKYIKKQNIFKFKEISRIIKMYYINKNVKTESFIWNYLIFQLWYEKYIKFEY